MGRAKTVEINGRKYDAVTGKLIKKSPKSTRGGGSIDGVVKAKPAGQVHKTTGKSTTLNRQAVSKSKPATSKKSSSSKKTSRHDKQSRSQAHKVDSDRQQRSKTITKSSLVSKFSRSKAKEAKEAEEEIIAPAQPIALPPKGQANRYSQKKSNMEEGQKPEKKKPSRRFNPFAKRPRAASVFAIALLVALFAGYITYLNIPNLSLKIAASRAGIDATMPGYRPAGFSIAGPINYSEGLVTISFQSNSDDRSFDIVERKSSWDSESLQANYVERETPNYVTFQDRGLTIYIYSGSNATWVDGGIWYTIEGESQLNSEQLLKIAASM